MKESKTNQSSYKFQLPPPAMERKHTPLYMRVFEDKIRMH